MLVFYLHEVEVGVIDYLIKLVDVWIYPISDLEVIKRSSMVLPTPTSMLEIKEASWKQILELPQQEKHFT